MPFMALMAAPLSAMLSVTGGDGSLDYPSHTRARTAGNLFWRHPVSPTRAGGWGAPHLGEPFNASIIAEIDTAFAPLASYRPKDLGSAVHGMPAVQPSAVETPLWGTFSGIRTGSLGAGSVGVGVGLGTTTGLGIVSGISMGSEPGC